MAQLASFQPNLPFFLLFTCTRLLASSSLFFFILLQFQGLLLHEELASMTATVISVSLVNVYAIFRSNPKMQ